MSSRDQAKFTDDELAVVLSHYDLGVIESITNLSKGSRKSPKAGVVAQAGKFFLKRLAPKRANPNRLQAKHLLLKHLANEGYPSPRIQPTRSTGATFLQLRDNIYELFEFVSGVPYRQSLAETRNAAGALAWFHEVTDPIGEQWPDGPGSYHNAPGIRTGLHGIGSNINSHDSLAGHEAELTTIVEHLIEAYDRAAGAVNQFGFDKFEDRLIHSDWHPGNVMFRDKAVEAVIDFDAVKRSKRVIDLANGALQFSMITGDDPGRWPAEIDRNRFNAFVAGYAARRNIREDEARCVVPLMIETLIAETVPPISTTGSVGKLSGFRILKMVRRKVLWLAQESRTLSQTVLDASA